MSRLLLIAAGWAALSRGQAQPPAYPKFQTASIRPCPAGAPEGRVDASAAAITLNCVTVDRLIRIAYLTFATGQPLAISPTTGLPVLPISIRQHSAPIAGSPPWLATDRFTIDAAAQEPATREMMQGPMMQSLLEDRFGLKIHRETRDIPVYNLTAASGGPRLPAAKDGGCIHLDLTIPAPPTPPGRAPPILCGAFRPSPRNDALEVRGVTIADLCSQFSVWLDRDVIDKTGITGVFDFRLEVAPAAIAAGLPAALNRLGLKLEPTQGPGEFLVIDRVEKPSRQ